MRVFWQKEEDMFSHDEVDVLGPEDQEDALLAIITPECYDDGTFSGCVLIPVGVHLSCDDAKAEAERILSVARVISHSPDGMHYIRPEDRT
jgi:hypothetical protein